MVILFYMLTYLCFQTEPSMLLVSNSVLAYLTTIQEVARVELHPWSGGGDGQGAARLGVSHLDGLSGSAPTQRRWVHHSTAQVHPSRSWQQQRALLKPYVSESCLDADTGQDSEMRGNADKPLHSELTGAEHCGDFLVIVGHGA